MTDGPPTSTGGAIESRSPSHEAAQTFEQAMFGRMGVSVEDVIATGTDALDEKMAAAVDAGIAMDQQLPALAGVLAKLARPETVAALNQLLDSLPQLAQLAQLANELPNVLATAGDILDSYQRRCAENDIDVEKAILNGMHAALFLGSKVDSEHLQRIGDLLASDILNPHAVRVVDNAAKSLTTAQKNVCQGSEQKQLGLFGMLSALRDPQIQRSLAFAVQFGRCFGNNLEQATKNDPS